MRSTLAPLPVIIRTVSPITPCCRPRRPQWATPITPASASASSTGRQSAAKTPRATPRRVVTWASASITVASGSPPSGSAPPVASNP